MKIAILGFCRQDALPVHSLSTPPSLCSDQKFYKSLCVTKRKDTCVRAFSIVVPNPIVDSSCVNCRRRQYNPAKLHPTVIMCNDKPSFALHNYMTVHLTSKNKDPDSKKNFCIVDRPRLESNLHHTYGRQLRVLCLLNSHHDVDAAASVCLCISPHHRQYNHNSGC